MNWWIECVSELEAERQGEENTMARARRTIDDEPEVYSQEWVEMIRREANRELRQRRLINSFRPLPCGYSVQSIDLFPEEDQIAIAMTTESGTVTLLMARSQAGTLSSELSRLLARSCRQYP
jgi:hypothetical protein